MGGGEDLYVSGLSIQSHWKYILRTIKRSKILGKKYSKLRCATVSLATPKGHGFYLQALKGFLQEHTKRVDDVLAITYCTRGKDF